MKPLHRLFSLLLCAVLLWSCEKEKREEPEDYSAFLRTSQLQFRGSIADSFVVWRYGWNEFQKGGSYSIKDPILNPTQSLMFTMVSEKDLSTRFTITTPNFISNRDSLFLAVLQPGFKNAGNEPGSFHLQLTLNGVVYTSYGPQAPNCLKILKTAPSKNETGLDTALVWMTANCRFYTFQGTYAFTVSDGWIIAEFMYDL